MSGSDTTLPPLKLDAGLGAVFIGVMINSLMCGVTLTQSLDYWRTYPRDRPIFKMLVGALVVVNLFHSSTAAAALYRWCITLWGQREFLGVGAFAYYVKSMTAGMAAFLVQSFYAWRIYTLSGGSPWIPIAVLFAATWQLVWALFVTARVFQVTIVSQFKTFEYAISCWLVGAAIGDIIITTAMIYELRKQKSGFLQTNGIITSLIVMTLGSNAVTAVIALVDIICYVTMTNSIHAAFLYNLPNFYINGLLVSLNSRERLRGSLNEQAYELSVNVSSSIPRGTNVWVDRMTVSKVDAALHEHSGVAVADEMFADPRKQRHESIDMEFESAHHDPSFQSSAKQDYSD